VKARTLLLMCSLSLASAPTAEAIAPLRGPEGWPLSSPDKSNDLRRRVPHKAQVAPGVPLPRPRPDVLEKTGTVKGAASNPVAAVPPAAPVPQAAPLATGHGVAGKIPTQTHAAETAKRAVEPVRGRGGVSMPPVSVQDAGGRVRIEAHDASVGQVLAALQESGLIQLSAPDQLSRTVNGTFIGTLPQVLSRILDGYDYFLRVTEAGTELHAFDAPSDAKAALRIGTGDANAASQSGSNGSNAASQNGVANKAEPAPPPVAAFALSSANPVSKARARVRVEQSAKRR